MESTEAGNETKTLGSVVQIDEGKIQAHLDEMVRSTVSDLNQKISKQIEEWRQQPLVGEFPYVFLDGLWLKRSWCGEVKNVSVLVAIGVAQTGYRRILGVSEGAKEDKSSGTGFLRELKEGGLQGVKLFVSDKCLGLVENLAEFYPEPPGSAAWSTFIETSGRQCPPAR